MNTSPSPALPRDRGAQAPRGQPERGAARALRAFVEASVTRARRARDWTQTPRARALARMGQAVGRAGYVGKGALYATVGALAVDAGIRPYDPLAGARRALLWIGEQWPGQGLVGVLAAGLLAYACWQLVQAVLDPRGGGLRGLGFRAVCVVSAVLYGGLAVQGLRLLAGAEADRGQRRRALVWMRGTLEQPMGRWALVAVGLGVLGYAAAQLLRALREPARSLDLSRLSRGARRRVARLARTALVARGAVAAVIAWFILRAALLYQPRELVGVAGALRVVREQPHGPALVVATGAGLIAYGLLQVLRAWYWDEPER